MTPDLTAEVTLADVVTELRAIRGLLEQQVEQQAICDHGVSGVCMACLMPLVNFHLEQMSSEIGTNVWEAVRKR